MHKQRFCLLIVFVGMSFQGDLAMDCADLSGQAVVNMGVFWSHEYNNSIGAVPRVEGLKKVRASLVKERYLPPDISPLHHLLYLSTIQNGNDKSKTLFTQKQQKKFDTAESVQRWVSRWFVINGAIIGVASWFPLTSAVSLLQCANGTVVDCLSSTSTVLTPAVLGGLGALAVGFSSLYATGCSPHCASQHANKVQNVISDERDKNSTLAKYWIDIYFHSPEKAEYIADEFDIEELIKRAQMKTCKKKLGSRLINPLKEAWHFIKHKTILVTFTEIESYIYNKINSQRIAYLEKELYKHNTKIKKIKQTIKNMKQKI